jgi:periplasmic divalent cation tolerance protein
VTGCCSVYVTTADEGEADAIARTLLDEKLVACANVLPGITSHYRWDGEVRRDREVAMLLKTRAVLAETVVARIKALHSYDCPAIVVWPIAGGNADYLDWIGGETAQKL